MEDVGRAVLVFPSFVGFPAFLFFNTTETIGLVPHSPAFWETLCLRMENRCFRVYAGAGGGGKSSFEGMSFPPSPRIISGAPALRGAGVFREFGFARESPSESDLVPVVRKRLGRCRVTDYQSIDGWPFGPVDAGTGNWPGALLVGNSVLRKGHGPLLRS